MTSRRALSQRLFADLSDHVVRNPGEYEEIEPAVREGVRQAVGAFPHGETTDGVMADLSNAYATIERNRAEDTSDAGVKPEPQTQSILQTSPLHPSTHHLPRRPNAFSMDFTHRESEEGKPLHVWDPVNQRYVPNPDL